jgi:hypothetical protein
MSSNNGDEKVFQTEGKSSLALHSTLVTTSNKTFTETLNEWTGKTKKLLKDGLAAASG